MGADRQPQGDLGFSYRRRKSGEVEIARGGRTVTTLRGIEAEAFLAAAEAGDVDDAQQLMARATGNYRRSNERSARNHPRNRR